jgi:protein gp37
MGEYSKIDYLLAQHDDEVLHVDRDGRRYNGGTWSPWIGCCKEEPDGTLREGCRHCWAEMWARRNPRFRGHWGRDTGRYFFGEEHWREPLRWQRKCERLGRRKRVLVSLCDPFETLRGGHPQRAQLISAKLDLLGLIEQTPMLDWLLLTKRPREIPAIVHDMSLPNLWLGVSVWDQPSADRMIPPLLEVPAAVRWVSAEPLLGPLDVSRWLRWRGVTRRAGEPARHESYPGELPRIDWLVVGCESRGARLGRPCDPRWARALTRRAQDVGVPMFTKQLEFEGRPGRLVKSKGLAALHWPVQMPEVRHG